MFKTTKKNASKVASTNKSVWTKLKQFFSFSNARSEHTKDIYPEVHIEELELELVEKPSAKIQPDIEIAFINPETGELEIINLPQGAMKSKIESLNFDKPRAQEPLVIMTMEGSIFKEKEEDLFHKITHFPPSSRLH